MISAGSKPRSFASLFRKELTTEPAPATLWPWHGAVHPWPLANKRSRHPDFGTAADDGHIELAIFAVEAAKLAFLIHIRRKREAVERRVRRQHNIFRHDLVHLQRQTVDGGFQTATIAILFVQGKPRQFEKPVIPVGDTRILAKCRFESCVFDQFPNGAVIFAVRIGEQGWPQANPVRLSLRRI